MRQLFLAAIAAGFVSFATEASATIYDATASQGIITLSGPPDWYTSQYPYDHTLEPRSMVVPEPGAWALLVMGIGLLGATLRRRRRTAQMRG